MSNADAGIRGQDVKIAGVEEMNKLFVDRELRMVELKRRILELENRTAPEDSLTGHG